MFPTVEIVGPGSLQVQVHRGCGKVMIPTNRDVRKTDAQFSRQNRHRVCFESVTVESSRAQYHLWHGETIHPAGQASPWKSQLGKAASARSRLLLPSSKRKSDTWDSRSKHVPVQWRYGIGASGIRTGATYRNGCLRSGELRWSHTSVARRDPPIKPALLAESRLICNRSRRPGRDTNQLG